MNDAAPVISGTRKFDRGLTRFLYHDLNWQKLEEQSVQKTQTDRQTDGQTDATDGFNIPANAVALLAKTNGLQINVNEQRLSHTRLRLSLTLVTCHR